MQRARTVSALTALAGVILILACPSGALANGSKGKKRIYLGEIAPREGTPGTCRLSVEIEPILFSLTSIEKKYRVFRIRIINGSATPLKLSRRDDRISIETGGGSANGILDLASHDAAIWDGLDVKLRESIAYPTSVPNGEEENVFVFLPAESVKEAPRIMRYTIAGLGNRTVLLAERIAKAQMN